MPGASLRVSTFGDYTARWMALGCGMADSLEQYVKQEVSGMGEHGREARATRLITERASMRIGKMACEIALQRPRKVRTLAQCSSIRHATFISPGHRSPSHPHPLFAIVILPVSFFPVDSYHEGDLAHTSSCFTIYPARHDHPQVKRLVCN